MHRSVITKTGGIALPLASLVFVTPAFAAPPSRSAEPTPGPTLVVLVSSPNDPHRAELEQYGALVASSLPQLRHVALASQHVQERFRSRHSSELKEVPITDIERYRDLVNELVTAYMLNQLRRVPRLAAAVDKLHAKVQHTIKDKLAVAVTTLDRCLLGVRMHFDKQALDEAVDLAGRCLVEAGGVEPTNGNHSVPVLEILERARERLARRAQADLVVTSSPEGCTAFINDFAVGVTPLRWPLTEGHYAVRVGCGRDARSTGRVHRVHVGARGASLHVDTAFERAVQLQPLRPVVLELSRPSDKRLNYVKYARRIAEVVGAADVVIVEYDGISQRLFIERRQVADRSLARYHELDAVLDSFAVLKPERGASALRAEITSTMAALLRGDDVWRGDELRNTGRLQALTCIYRVRHFLERKDSIAADAVAMRCWLAGVDVIAGLAPFEVAQVLRDVPIRIAQQGCERDVRYWLRTGDRPAAHFAARGCVLLGKPAASAKAPAAVREIYLHAMTAVQASCTDRIAYLLNASRRAQAREVAQRCVAEDRPIRFWGHRQPAVMSLLQHAGWRESVPHRVETASSPTDDSIKIPSAFR